MTTWAAAVEGFWMVFSWPNILYPTVATLAAMVFAFLPGLSGVTLMALAIPLTFGWDPLHVTLAFGAFVGGATFMGSVTAILFNIPGTGPSAATMIDGHPMAQLGQARTAIGCSATASALGSTFGVAVLILLLPVLRHFILAFGPAEFLMLAIWGLATIAAMVGPSLVKGLLSASLGLLVAFIGVDPRSAEPRFTFGSIELQDGLGVVPVFLGIFAMAEMAELATSGRRSVSGLSRPDQLSGSLREGVLSVFRNFGLFLRSSVLGTVVGMIPAVGGTVASFLAYGHAVQSAGDRSQFGKGDIRGVIAPEAAHDAKDGGSLAPTLAFGIPGNEGTALLLAALTLHGMVPGRELLSEKLPLAFVLIWSLFYSNWLTSILGVALSRPLANLSVVRTSYLAPLIFALGAVGAYTHQSQFRDVIVAFVFGIAAFYLKKHGWPLVPFVTALVLGPLFETNLHLTLRLQQVGSVDVFSRPIVLALVLLMMLIFGVPKVRQWRARHVRKAA